MRREDMSRSAIKPAKLADAISQHIRQLILEGTLQPGERLQSERELSAKLEVSRPSLRQALGALIAEGLLVTDSQGVAYVSEGLGKTLRDPLLSLMETPEARIDCMELRSVVEAAAAAFAARRASKVDREALSARFEAILAAHKSGDVDRIANADAEFHFAIYEASHNLMMLHFMHSLESILRSNVYTNRKNLYQHRAEWDSQLREHEAIFEAIMAGDPDRACEAARMHMTTAMRTQHEIHEAERRLQASIRRMSRAELIARPKKRRAAP